MKVNARTEEFQHIELFDKFALFTNARIVRSTVPEGWYCYDIRGSDDDPGELCYMEENVVVNHAGSVLMPEKLAMPKSGRLDVRDELGFLDEGDMTLREFCEAHQLPYPAENMKFHIRPARPEEAGLFYTPHPEEDKRLGTVGHVRMDFGRSGNEFWHTWWPRGPEELNSPAFKAELQEVVDTLRESVLKNRLRWSVSAMNTAGKSAAAGHRTTVTLWKRSITATACAAIRLLEIITATVRPMIWMSSGRTWRGTSPWWAVCPMPMAMRRNLWMRTNFSVAYRRNCRTAPPPVSVMKC